MKELKIFYLENCPYCRQAMAALDELIAETPDYGKVKIRWIEETLCPEIAERYEYYRVPSVFCGEEKLYECDSAHDRTRIRRQLENALKTAAGSESKAEIV